MQPIRDYDIPSATIPFTNIKTPESIALPNPTGIITRAIHSLTPFDQIMDPKMLPYDARYTNLKYYAIMLTNLIDSCYNSFMQLPPSVKADIQDNFVNMCKLSMIGKYIITRFF